MTSSFDDKVMKCIPAEFFMISSSQDNQISNEAYNAGSFELPDPAGKAGGACTSAILDVFYSRGHEINQGISWVDILKDMHEELKKANFDQVPQLSSSRWIDVNQPMYIVPPKSGVRRALLIGINYVGQKGQLKACHNDVENVKDYLIKAQGFRESEMLILKDDGEHDVPTKQNIMDGFTRLTQYSQPGDVVFVSFSGHGGRVVDTSGDEDDGFDESLIPVDFVENGQIVDDDILDLFVKKMKGGVTCTVIMDCCHSGSVMDLPYYFSADGKEMETEKNFQFESSHASDPLYYDQNKKKKHKKVLDKHGNAVRASVKEEQEKAEKPKPKRTVHEAQVKKIKPRAPPRDRKAPPPPPPQRCVIQ